MKCPKCNSNMNSGYRITLGSKKPMQEYWFCNDHKKCKFAMLKKKPKPE